MSYQLEPEDFRFSKVVEWNKYYQHSTSTPHQRFIDSARNIIDHVDPQICELLGNFGLQGAKEAPQLITPTVVDKLDGTPIEFIMSLLKYIDFQNVSPDVAERNTRTLAGFIAQRFSAISLVAHGKKLNGERSPFHPERHENVLSDRAKRISSYGHDKSLSRAAFEAFMQAGCNIQEAYMNDREANGTPMQQRLEHLGVTL